MKKLNHLTKTGTLFLLLLFIGSIITAHAQDSLVTISDAAFLYALIGEGVDTNGDSLISYSEAEAMTNLTVSGESISDMTGIEVFINLDSLDCAFNELTSLDVSDCTALTYLICLGNNLTSLDVSGCTNLKHLNCGFFGWVN